MYSGLGSLVAWNFKHLPSRYYETLKFVDYEVSMCKSSCIIIKQVRQTLIVAKIFLLITEKFCESVIGLELLTLILNSEVKFVLSGQRTL